MINYFSFKNLIYLLVLLLVEYILDFACGDMFEELLVKYSNFVGALLWAKGANHWDQKHLEPALLWRFHRRNIKTIWQLTKSAFCGYVLNESKISTSATHVSHRTTEKLYSLWKWIGMYRVLSATYNYLESFLSVCATQTAMRPFSSAVQSVLSCKQRCRRFSSIFMLRTEIACSYT